MEDVWEKRTPGLALERGQRVRKAPGWLKPEQYIDPLQPYSLVGGPPPPKGRGSEEEGGEEDPASDPGAAGSVLGAPAVVPAAAGSPGQACMYTAFLQGSTHQVSPCNCTPAAPQMRTGFGSMHAAASMLGKTMSRQAR